MELQKFITNFTTLFEDTDPSLIIANTKFRDLDEWSSLIGMSLLAMAKVNYDRTISSIELRNCITVEDIYKLIASK